MQCLSMLSRYRLASGADEKVLRIFNAPRQFMETFQGLCKVKEKRRGTAHIWSIVVLKLVKIYRFQDDKTGRSITDAL
ncbi:Elongator subunit elp2 [Desmophyllum pertusum]|uniref:Elongator subunit elp2 n=1 Tax=Desmophyllum pertusum TaxID=174260 RepID=A0A9X0CVE6_9CNID|nr:Elongator subunit elp2 [Desmophyllum pertusum]